MLVQVMFQDDNEQILTYFTPATIRCIVPSRLSLADVIVRGKE